MVRYYYDSVVNAALTNERLKTKIHGEGMMQLTTDMSRKWANIVPEYSITMGVLMTCA